MKPHRASFLFVRSEYVQFDLSLLIYDNSDHKSNSGKNMCKKANTALKSPQGLGNNPSRNLFLCLFVTEEPWI